MFQTEKQVLEMKLKKTEDDLSRQLSYAQQVRFFIELMLTSLFSGEQFKMLCFQDGPIFNLVY